MTRRAFRIGQFVPSSNTTMETEIPAMLHAREAIRPERFTFHSSRMRMHKVVREELEAMNRQGLRCAAELADARVDVMSRSAAAIHCVSLTTYAISRHRVSTRLCCQPACRCSRCPRSSLSRML
jgi:maleate cis-trans isomerase